jgi:hypothetical protein
VLRDGVTGVVESLVQQCWHDESDELRKRWGDVPCRRE